jgi:peptide/nickel transport system substrate-binding protein
MPEDIIKPNQPQTSPEPEEPKTDGQEESIPIAVSVAPEPTEPAETEEQPSAPPPPANPAINTVEPETPQPPLPPTLPPLSNEEPKRRGPKAWVIVIAIVLIAAISTIAALLIAKSDDTTKSTSNGAVEKKDIAHLRYAVPDGDLSQLYPAGNSATSVQLNSQIFEGLVRYDEQTKIVPLLATNWSNPDTSTWTFDIRKDVKFHSGKTLTAADVKYSIDYAVSHQEDENTNFFLASSITGVEVVNDYQVKITTDGPDPTLLNRLAYIYIVDSEVEPGRAEGGTGPYVVKPDTTPSEKQIELVAYDKYHGGHIYTKSLTMSIVPDAKTMISDLNNNTYDLAGSLEPKELAQVKSFEKIEGQNFSVGFIGINTLKEDSPLASPQARQAVSYALDREKILKAGDMAGEPTGQLIPPKIPGHDPALKNTKQDVAKAKELLLEVNNASAPLTLSYAGSDNTAHMTEIANQLKAAGFNVTLKELPDLDALVNAGFSGETDMFYIVYDSPTLDGYDFFSTILQGNNIFDNQEINEQIDESASILKPSERLNVLKQISKEVAEDAPVVPVYVPADLFALKKPYYIQTDIPGAQAGVYFWQTYQK